MLYISRCVGKDRYGVVDTDDGSESVVPYSELYYNCFDLGLDIFGVNTYPSEHLEFISSVVPVQPIETVTVAQTKLKVMYNVAVTVYKDVVSNIRIDGRQIVSPVRVVLSRYGKSCGDCLLTGNLHSNSHKITLVFDDKISFTDKVFKLHDYDDTFMWRDAIGVMFDVRAVSNRNKAMTAYKSFFNGDPKFLFDSVIDHEWRKEQFKQIFR